jgi:hypothetical protein
MLQDEVGVSSIVLGKMKKSTTFLSKKLERRIYIFVPGRGGILDNTEMDHIDALFLSCSLVRRMCQLLRDKY